MPITPGHRRSIMLHVDRVEFETLLDFYGIETDTEPFPTGNTLYALVDVSPADTTTFSPSSLLINPLQCDSRRGARDLQPY